MSVASVTDLAEQIRQLEELRDMYDQRVQQMRADLAARLTVGEVAGQYALRPGRKTFDQELARQVLPEAVRLECRHDTVSPEKVRKAAADLWAECIRTGEPYLAAVRS